MGNVGFRKPAILNLICNEMGIVCFRKAAIFLAMVFCALGTALSPTLALIFGTNDWSDIAGASTSQHNFCIVQGSYFHNDCSWGRKHWSLSHGIHSQVSLILSPTRSNLNACTPCLQCGFNQNACPQRGTGGQDRAVPWHPLERHRICHRGVSRHTSSSQQKDDQFHLQEHDCHPLCSRRSHQWTCCLHFSSVDSLSGT